MSELVATLIVTACCTQARWEPDEFPISFWAGPPPAYNTRETWQTVADANFTVVGTCLRNSAEENRRMLDFCRDVGLKALVVDHRIGPEMIGRENWQRDVEAVVAEYGAHPALYGYYVDDEPGAPWFEALAQVQAEFLKRDPRHLPYVNLFPTYASAQQLGTPTYAEYVQRYMQTVSPLVLSYDNYALLKADDRLDYFENLAVIREAALANHVPAWNIILVTPHGGYRDPSAGELRWQAYTSLAYGMRGILYFTYFGNDAVVDAEGRPTKHYGVVKQLNSEIRSLGPDLLGLESTAVYHSGAIPPGCTRLPTDAPVQVALEQPLVIGFFRDTNGNSWFMLVNRNYREAQQVRVDIKPHVTGVTEINARDGRETDRATAGGSFTVSLAAGDGRLFRLETSFSYPEPRLPLKEVDFEFKDGLDGWTANQFMKDPAVSSGVFHSRISGADPYLVRTFLNLEPDRYSRIVIRMKMPGGKTGQVFWQTESEPAFSATKYINFPTVGDNEFHEYKIDVGKHPKWRGQRIKAVRIDPTIDAAAMGQVVEIDWIRAE